MKKTIKEALSALKMGASFFVCDNTIYALKGVRCYEVVEKSKELLWITRNLPHELADEIDEAGVAQLLKRIKREPMFQRDLECERVKSENLLNLKNGVLDLNTGTFVNSEVVFTYELDFKYLPEAKIEDAPEMLRYLQTSLDADTDPDKVKTLFQIIGVCLSSATKHRHAYLLVGPTRCGKSIICGQIAQLISPRKLVESLSLHELSGKFNTIRLTRSRLNVCTEIGEGQIRSTDVFKKLISEEPISVEAKNENGYTATPHCKLLFAANAMPNFGGLDASGNRALYDRLVILRYNHSVEEDDKLLDKKIYSERDVWGSLAIKELMELIKNGFEFTESKDARELREIAQQDDESLRLFIEMMCEFKGRVHRRTFTAAYNAFCENNGFKPYNNAEVRQYVTANYPQVRNAKFSICGSYLWGWDGLSIKEENINE